MDRDGQSSPPLPSVDAEVVHGFFQIGGYRLGGDDGVERDVPLSAEGPEHNAADSGATPVTMSLATVTRVAA